MYHATAVLRQRASAALAVMNVGKLRAPLAELDEFRLALDPINHIATVTPGFLWMYTDDYQDTTSAIDIPELTNDPLLMPQLSLWKDAPSLFHFVFKSGHAIYYKRKREWFETPPAPTLRYYTVCWWHDYHNDESPPPTMEEAFVRLRALNEQNGESTSFAFDLKAAKAGTFLLPSSNDDDDVDNKTDEKEGPLFS